MKKQNIEEYFMDYIDGKLSEDDLKKIIAGSEENAGKLNEIEQLKDLYNRLDTIPIPEPGDNLDKNFYNMLENISAAIPKPEKKTNIVAEKIAGLVKSLTLPKIGYSTLLLIVGIALGKLLWPAGSETRIDQMSAELKSMKEVMMLTLLQQPSATERIKAVSSIDSGSDVDNRVINALIETLNTDPNVNVRLATIESLSGLTQNPQVRQGLVQSIVNQKSPLVQIALADLMVSLREKNSIGPLQNLLKDKEIKHSVKTKIESCIAKI